MWWATSMRFTSFITTGALFLDAVLGSWTCYSLSSAICLQWKNSHLRAALVLNFSGDVISAKCCSYIDVPCAPLRAFLGGSPRISSLDSLLIITVVSLGSIVVKTWICTRFWLGGCKGVIFGLFHYRGRSFLATGHKRKASDCPCGDGECMPVFHTFCILRLLPLRPLLTYQHIVNN